MEREAKQWSVKYRPRNLEEFVGSEDTKKAAAAIIKNKSAHALLITGQSGCGKTTLSKIIAAEINGLKSGDKSQYITELNVGAEGGKDSLVNVVKSANFIPPEEGKYRVFILEEVHALTKQALNALLRPIEEPPHPYVMWILVTDKPWNLDVTLLDRCRKLPVAPPSEVDVAKYVFRVMKKENALNKLDDEDRKKAAKRIAHYANCVPRAAIQLLADVHEAGIRDFDEFKRFVSTSNKSVDNSLDSGVAVMLTAMLDKNGNVEKRVNDFMKHYVPAESMGILSRMLYQLHALVTMATTGGFNYALKKLLAEFDRKKIKKPSIEHINLILFTLAKLRMSLTTVPVDPSFVILPIMLDLIIENGETGK